MALITNYPELYYSEADSPEAFPDTITKLRSIILNARVNNKRVRAIGRSHSLHLGNLPRNGEIVIRLDSFAKCEFISPGVIRVGAGADLRLIQQMLLAYRCELPVINGGNGSPSVGGFICAGGIGKTEEHALSGRSSLYGGFWENVLSITVMTGNGKVKTISKEDSEFIWHFGGQGQFGLILEAELVVVPTGPPLVNYTYPFLVDPPPNKSLVEHRYLTSSTSKTLWVSVLCADEELDKSWNILNSWVLSSDGNIKPVEEARWAGPDYNGRPLGYSYNIKCISANPPLLYRKHGSFWVIGVAFNVAGGSNQLKSRLKVLFDEIYSLLLREQLQIYISVENVNGTISAKDYYSADIFARATQLRSENHCNDFLNCGWLDCPGELQSICSVL